MATNTPHLVISLFKPGLRPITVTTTMFFEKARAEISRSVDLDAVPLRIIALPQHENPMISVIYEEAFGGVWTKLTTKEAITCALTEQVHPTLDVAPRAVIMDVRSLLPFAAKPFAFLRQAAPGVKIYTWHPSAALSGFYLFGPESLGGRGNLLAKAEAEAAATGQPFDVVATEVSIVVVRVPGLPPMYDYEYQPQTMPLPPPLVSNLFVKAHDIPLKTDGVISMGPEALEPESAAALRKWFGDLSTPVYFAGPLLPEGEKAATAEKDQSPLGSEIQVFLDRKLQTCGENSISFGFVFFPLEPEKFTALLDVVMGQGILFIISHLSPFAVIPDDLKTRVEEYGHGLLSPWSPQQTILRHPMSALTPSITRVFATGWFLSHWGFNSALEAINAGPQNTIHLTKILDTGYELLEVRTGHGLRPIYRNGKTPSGTVEAVKAEVTDVLKRAFGEEGEGQEGPSACAQGAPGCGLGGGGGGVEGC
ncbi:hypothetical protein GSI_01881 [Ganoderma sinense ZZ0214-1]|uniref:Uncharacterized protein n=1 Tax=Ganoderma sinense ZZ0214-1 TaxID=1077348 RepID=A0A2G8SR41_9APHY|nr:hypothetical protein GSI_01881 [Ganoderma sinense ZZ0214-1]